MPLSVALLRIHQIGADLEQEDDGCCCWGSRKDQRRITASAARHCQFRGRITCYAPAVVAGCVHTSKGEIGIEGDLRGGEGESREV